MKTYRSKGTFTLKSSIKDLGIPRPLLGTEVKQLVTEGGGLVIGFQADGGQYVTIIVAPSGVATMTQSKEKPESE